MSKIHEQKTYDENFVLFFILEKYFDMNKKQCREGLDIYKKFLDRTDKVSNFLKVAEVSLIP